MGCVFCDRLAAGDLEAENELAAAFPDAFPLTRGHTLVAPRRHEADYFALTAAEQTAMWRLVNAVRARLERELHPDGYNLGVNVSQAAGQTVDHVHIHLIPRYAGDADDPAAGSPRSFPPRRGIGSRAPRAATEGLDLRPEVSDPREPRLDRSGTRAPLARTPPNPAPRSARAQRDAPHDGRS